MLDAATVNGNLKKLVYREPSVSGPPLRTWWLSVKVGAKYTYVTEDVLHQE